MRNSNKYRAATQALLASFLLATSTSIFAVDMIAEILAKKGVITAEEYAQIKAAQSKQPTIDTSDGLKVVSPDKSFSAQLGTLLQMDAASYDSNIKDSAGRDIANSGSEFRRARLSLSGTFLTNWDYKTEVDFANSAQITDGYVAYLGFQPRWPILLTVGHFKIPFSHESLMADKSLTLMERSLPNAFTNSRAPGAMLSAGQNHWSAAVMAFGEQLSNTPSNISDEGGGMSLRTTWAPWIEPGATLHFGVAYSLREPTRNNVILSSTTATEGVRLRSKPESNVIETRLVDTGATGIVDVDQLELTGLELGASWQALNVNAEYMDSQIQRNNGKSAVDLSGWYAQTSWMLTGEQRTYKGDKGLFDGIKPARNIDQGGIGAWEIALRLAEIDLNDGSPVLQSGQCVPEVNGGKERNATFALNWYLNPFLRISTNYVKVLDIEQGPVDGKDLDAFQARFQLAY